MTFFNNNFDTRDIIAIALVAGHLTFAALGIENQLSLAAATLAGTVIGYYFKSVGDERRDTVQKEKEMR